MAVASCSSPRTAVIILAAGLSSRMGRPKLLLPFRGRPLAAYASAVALSCGIDGGPPGPVIAVVGPHAPAALPRVLGNDPRVTVICAEDAALGQAASLRAGIRRVLEEEKRGGPVRGVCVLLGDQPLVEARTVRRLIAALEETPDAFIVPVHNGQRGNPVIIPRAFFARALALRGDTGARPLLRAPDARVRRVPVEEVGVLRDVDTPEAYAALARGDHEATGGPALPSGNEDGILSGMNIPDSVSSPKADATPSVHPLAALPPLSLPDAPCGDIPDEDACRALWDKYGMLDNIRAHSAQVAALAVNLAELAAVRGGGVSVPMVRAAALLHDIAKTYTITHGGSHAQLGASWVVSETRNRAIAQGVMLHVHWPWPVDPARVCSLPFFVIYADKRIKHDRCVSLRERFEDLLVRYGHTEQARAGIQESYRQGQTIERALAARLGLNLHACTLDCGRLVERT